MHVAALARDDAAKAVENLPLTFIFIAPRRRRGPPHRHRRRRGRRPRRRPAARRPTPCAAPGRSRSTPIPKQPAVASQTFLVEDFVPDRIEFDLTSDKRRDRRRRAGQRHRRRPLPLRRAGRRPGARRRGRARRRRANGRAFPGYSFGLADEQEGDADAHPARPTCRSSATTARRPSRSRSTQLPSTTRLLNADVTVRMRESRRPRRRAHARHSASSPQTDMIGIRPDFAGDEVPQGGTAKFSVIAVDPGRRAARPWPARSGRWSRSSATTSGIAAAIPGTTSR